MVRVLHFEREGTGEGQPPRDRYMGGRRERAEETGERQMGDKAKWIQLIQTDFDKWHSDREMAEMHTLAQTHTHTHTHTYSIMQTP